MTTTTMPTETRTAAEKEHAARVYRTRCRPHFEVQLSESPDFPSRFGRRLKAIAGTYNACRGDSRTRFVIVPANRAGRALLRDILAAYPRERTFFTARRDQPGTVVIARRFPRISERSIQAQSYGELLQKLTGYARQSYELGHLPEPKTAAERQTEALARARRRVEELREALVNAVHHLNALESK